MEQRVNLGSGRAALKRVKKARTRARWTTFFYMYGVLGLLSYAVMPIFNPVKINYLNVIPGFCDGKMLWQELNLGLNLDTVNRGLYALMLLILLFSSLKALGCFFKCFKLGDEPYNHCTRCMKSASNTFSVAFAVILIIPVLIAAINGSYAGTEKFKLDAFKELFFDINAVIRYMTGVADLEGPYMSVMGELEGPYMSVMGEIVYFGVVYRLLFGFIGAKVSYFSLDDNDRIIENKRVVGRGSAVFRNFLQLMVVVAIPLFLLQVNTLDTFVADLLAKNFTMDIPAFIQLGILLLWIVLVGHATGATEYNINGAKGKGMSTFTWFSLFTAFAAAGLYYMTNGLSFDFNKVEIFNSAVLVAVPFVMFIIQILMRKAPGIPKRMEIVKTRVPIEQIFYDEI